jgi:flavin-dependent dehydrogenase
MQSYDVIIIGGGIAGASLAYNLSKVCPRRNVLLMDPNMGLKIQCTYRNITEDIVKQYNFSYIHKYKGINVGSDNTIYFTVKKNLFLIEYEKACLKLIKKSGVDISSERALNLNKKLLFTNGVNYKFKYLIDCSGKGFFLRRIHKYPLPFRYWVGVQKLLDLQSSDLKDQYLSCLFDDYGNLEEIYPFKRKILWGNYIYSDLTKSYPLKSEKKLLLPKLIKKWNIEREYRVVIPCTPTFPIAYKNYALLGDSFGNAATASAIGIKPILESSEMLADAISKENIKLYEARWKRKNLKSYVSFLSSRLTRFPTNNIFNYLRKTYPGNKEVFNVLRENPQSFTGVYDNASDFRLPSEVRRLYPPHFFLVVCYHYLRLLLKYQLVSMFN